MKSRLLAVLCAVVAGPALAQCPTAADLRSGVRVTESDGTTNVFTAVGDGIVQNDGATTGGYTYRNLLAQGTHLIGLSDTDGGEDIPNTVRRMEYDMAIPALPVPAPGMRNTYETVVTVSDGSYDETQTQVWGQPTRLTIGDCTYDMIPGKLVYTNRDFVVREGLYYLPALEFALLHSYQSNDDPAAQYVATGIEAVE